jgi:hypothetical protein
MVTTTLGEQMAKGQTGLKLKNYIQVYLDTLVLLLYNFCQVGSKKKASRWIDGWQGGNGFAGAV